MALTGSDYGNVVFQGTDPATQFNQFQKDDAALTSNSLEDSIRRNQIEITKQQAHQEGVKSQQIDQSWRADQEHRKAVQANTKAIPSPGYYDPSENPDPVPSASGGNTPDAPLYTPSANDVGSMIPGMIGLRSSNSLASALAPAPPQSSGDQALAAQLPDEGANTLARGVNQPQGLPPQSAAPSAPVTPSSVPAAADGRKPMDLSNPATYRTVIDDEGYRRDMALAGFDPEGMKNSVARQEALGKVYDAQKKQFESVEKKMGLIANASQSLLTSAPIDFNLDPNSAEAQNQRDTFQTVGRRLNRQLRENGVITPAEEAQHDALLTNPTPQLIAQLQGISDSATGAEAQHREHREFLESQQRILNGQSENQNRQSEISERDTRAADKRVSDAAATLSTATSAADYDAKKDALKLDSTTAARLPESKNLDFSPKGLPRTQESIVTRGMNAEQLAGYQLRKLSEQSLVETRRANEQFRQFMTQGQPSPAQREATRTINDLTTKTEAPLWKEAGRLAEALRTGEVYITKGGAEQTFNPENKDGQVHDMQVRLNGIQSQLRSTTGQRYDLMDRFGASPSVSRQDALKAIDGLGPPLKEPAGPKVEDAGPATAPTPKQTPAAAAPSQKIAPAPQTRKSEPSQNPLKVLAPDGKTVLTFDSIDKRDAFFKAHNLVPKQ